VPATPSRRHKLQGAISRFVHQLDRTKSYIALVVPVLPDDDADPNRQYCLQTVVLMLHTFMEEYFKILVSLLVFWRAPDARTYLAQRYPDRASMYVDKSAPELMKTVPHSEVSFRNRASKLRGILTSLTDAGPFADEDSATVCLDLVAVRNIITHAGGWPSSEHIPTVSSPHVFVETDSVGSVPIYKLQIRRQFLTDVFLALGQSIQGMETALLADPRYRL